MARQSGHALTGLSRADLDISDAAAVIRAVEGAEAQLVINAAGYTAVDKAEGEPEKAMAVNCLGPENLARACAARGVPLFHISTDYVFDGAKGAPYVEADLAHPLGNYGKSKWAGEQAVRRHADRHVILRTAWVFGAHGPNFVKTILRLAKERPELRVVADQHGNPTHAGSIADALLLLAGTLEREGALPWGTYHYAGHPATTWHAFAEAIVQAGVDAGMLPKAVPVRPIATAEYPTPAKRPADARLDTSLADQALGLAPPLWAGGLREMVAGLSHDPSCAR